MSPQVSLVLRMSHKEIYWNLRLKRMSKSKGGLENMRGLIESDIKLC